nr:hypothetical protein [Lactiplantibacillus plantarum]
MPVVGELIQFQFGCFTVGGPMNLFKVTDHGLAVFYANFCSSDSAQHEPGNVVVWL